MKRFATSILGIAMLAGCHVDQQKEVETYRQVIRLTDERVEHSPNAPLNLKKAILLANQNDEGLASRGEEYLRARIARQRDIASFLPTVDLAPVYSRRDKSSSNSSSTGTGNNSQTRSFDVTADASINIFNGMQDVNRTWRDDFIARQRRFELLSSQEQLLIDTASVFYQVLRSESSVNVLESSLTVQGERYRDAKARVDAKIASPLAASQTEAQIAGTKTTLISARSDVVQARSRLRLLTDAEVDSSRLEDDFDPQAVAALPELIAAANANRDDLRAAEAAVEAARHDVDVAIGQYYPSVSIDFSAYLHRETIPTDRTWEGLLRVNLPIFTGGRIAQDVREAWSNFRQALLARNGLERSIRSQVEQAFAALSASDERLSQLQVQVAAASDALNQADQSYQAGRATNLDRIQAQDALLQAQLQLASEMYDRKLFHLTLLQRIGRLREQFESPPATQQTTPEIRT